jgi:multiple sugar transport system permease protein
MAGGAPVVLNRRRSVPGKRIVAHSARHVVAVVASLFFLLPFLVAVLTSLKPNSVAQTQNALSLPTSPTFANYIQVFTLGGFGQFALNSIIVSVTATIVQTAVCVLAGYALAKLSFPGRRVLFIVVLMTLMVPPEALAIPLFLEVLRIPLAGGNDIMGSGGIGLQASYAGLIAPYLVSGFSIFLSRQFFLGLPSELGQAARIDGCGEWNVFWRIYRPLATPLYMIVALFAFQNSWVAFLWPLITAGGPDHFTLQVGLSQFQQQYTAQWGSLMAAAVVASLPILVIFFFAQRHLREGIAFSGGKA